MDPLATAILIAVWGGALAGVILNLAWVEAPKWVTAVVYLTLGWVAVVAFPDLISELGVVAALLLGSRRPSVHPGRDRLRAQASGPGAVRVRLPRGVPRAGDRGRRAAVRGGGVLRPARSGLTGTVLT